MREGESASDTEIDSMYVIMSGELTVHVGGRDTQHIVAVMRKGEIVGERALLLQQDRAATVKAKLRCALFCSLRLFRASALRVPAGSVLFCSLRLPERLPAASCALTGHTDPFSLAFELRVDTRHIPHV